VSSRKGFPITALSPGDNPRSENPQHIIAEVVDGMTVKKHEIIVNRAAAIDTCNRPGAAARYGAGRGKGHEDYQEVNGVKYPFSDAAVAQEALKIWQTLQPARNKPRGQK